jgi:deoxyribonuclease IV
LGKGKDNGIKQLVKSYESAVDKYKSIYDKKLNVTVLLENGWGSSNAMGSTLEELREILDKLPNKGYDVCLDTCHAFAS